MYWISEAEDTDFLAGEELVEDKPDLTKIYKELQRLIEYNYIAQEHIEVDDLVDGATYYAIYEEYDSGVIYAYEFELTGVDRNHRNVDYIEAFGDVIKMYYAIPNSKYPVSEDEIIKEGDNALIMGTEIISEKSFMRFLEMAEEAE